MRPLPAGAWPRILMPALIGALALGGWEWMVRANGVPAYVLPSPSTIWKALLDDWPLLSSSLLVTLEITFAALALAAAAGLALAVLFAQSKWIELSLFPYAVALQVTPIVAIAPLIVIWVEDVRLVLLTCAWIVAFFPILANTTLGLNSVDRNLADLFRLHRATRLQTLLHLRLPSALPFFLAGLRISGGLALIGAIVAEFVAGTGGRASGLAYRILEAGYQLRIPRMFAALLLICLAGIAIFVLLGLAQHLALRHWHESATRPEG